MPTLTHVASRVVKGLPYLEKELSRRLSIKTGMVLTTPTIYYLIFSGKCNLACSFCTIYKQREPILSEETVHRVVRETKELSKHGYNISMSGGEPTIFKPLYSTLELAQKLGIDFGFTTNGLTLTKGNVERILRSDPFNINVSIESIDPQINERLRPADDGTRRALLGIETLLAEKHRVRARVSVIVKPTIMEQNYRTLPALVRHFGRDAKVQVNFQPFVGMPGDPHWVQDINSLRGVLDELKSLRDEGYPIIGGPDVFDNFFEYLSHPPIQGHTRQLELGGAKRNCDIGLRAMGIFPNGDVHFCDFLGQAVGNIYRNSLSEIFHGDTANGQRQQMVYCSIDCQQTCKRPTPLLAKAKSFLRMG